MSQHDFNIANQGFPATRSDINNALAALASTSSGTSEPSTTYANQFWYDTTNNLLKFRNEADSAWITLAYLDQATNEWEIRSSVIQAVDSAGISLKTDDGTARVVIQDDGDVAFDTDTLFVDAVNDRVGIGTSSPTSELTIGADSPQIDFYKTSSADILANIRAETDAGSGGKLIFQTKRNGNTALDRMTIDDDGNVGIGTSGPAFPLHAVGNGTLARLGGSGGDYHGLQIQCSDASGSATKNVFIDALNENGAAVANMQGQVQSDGGSSWIWSTQAVGTRTDRRAERMRINADGTVLINTTSFFQSTKMGIEAPNIDIFSVRGNNVGAGYRYDSTSSTGLVAYFSHSSNTVAAGSITIGSGSTSYNTSSDYRLKENVTNITDGITRIKQLEPKRFNFIINPDRTVDGFLAHEAQSVVPEAVTGTHNETRAITNAVLSSGGALLAENVLQADWAANKGDDEDDLYPSDSTWTASHTEPVYQGIDQSKLVPLLTAALQEAITKIEDLEARVAALESA